MKYLVVIGDGMADNPVEALGGKTPLEYADIPTIDSLAARGTVGSVVNCPKPLPAGSETAILSIFGCDPLKHFSGRSPMEAAAIGLRLVPGDAAFRCNLVALEPGDQPYEEKRILSHSAGSIAGQDALDVVAALNSDPEFSAALRAADMYIDPSPSFRPLAVKHHCDPSGVCFIPPHDHLGEVIGPLLPSGKDAALAKVFADLMRLANRVLEHHPVTEKRRAEGKLGANGIWFWAAGTAMQLPNFREEYGCGGAVISAVPLCHGIGVLRGLEMVEVEGATGEIDTNFEGKLEATWASLQKYDFVCLHLEAPDECTHNGDLKGKVQAIDYSAVSVEKARKVNAGAIAAGQCTVQQASVAELPFEAEQFDVVTAFETVYFWPELAQNFREVYRVLKPGGTFFICNEANGETAKDDKWTQIINGMTIYTDADLKVYLEQAGFGRVQSHKNKKGWLCVTAQK